MLVLADAIWSRVDCADVWRTVNFLQLQSVGQSVSTFNYRPFGRPVLCALLFLVLGTLSASVAAQSADPAIAKGVAWLQSQVQSDRSLVNESNSIATPFQVRAETTVALASVATAPVPLIAGVEANSDNDTDYLARRALALGAAQQDVNAIVSSIAASANSDGGWSLSAGYTTDALDTAMALTTLCGARGPASAISAGAAALQFLQSGDGGFGLTSTDDLYVSLWSLRAFDACVTQSPAPQPAAALTTWVLAQRNATNDFGDVQSDAMGLLALLGRTTSTTILGPLANALHNTQASDGSWSEDPYLTALAVEALAANSQLLPSPTTGAVSGAVVDTNGTPLSGATVMLAGTTSSTSSAADGTFTLSSVPPGTYTLQAALVGYSTASQNVTITAGTVVDVGNITLSANALYATLTGTVTNSSGTGLSSAIVSVGSQSALTNAQGAYELDGLPPGAATITVAAYGYNTATAAVTFAAGQRYVFSPTLYASTPPPTATLIGTVVDATSQTPISGASIALGTSTATTSGSGQFTLAGLTPGSFSLTVSAPNYQTLTVTGTSVGGTNNLGTLPLTLAQTTSSMSGTVTDATSNAPITGATIAISGTSLSASTDSTGHYSITGISSLSFSVSVSASGYQTRQLPVQLTAPTALTLNASLLTATTSNISFTSVTTSQTAYAPNGTLEVDIDIANTGSTAADVAIVGNILDSNGNVIFSMLGDPSGPAQNLQNAPFTVPSGGTTKVELAHPFLRQPAGSYTVDVRGYSNSGQILAETTVAFTVNSAGVLGGSAQGNPPLLQAGTNTPVDFSAQMGDLGNAPIPAGNAQLTVTLQDVDPSYNASDKASLKLVGVTPLAFGPMGLTTDANGNFYTASYYNAQLVEMTPAGQASVAIGSSEFNFAPRDFALDPQGNYFFTQGNSNIWEISAQGTKSQFPLNTGMTAIGIAIDASGNQYYAGANTLEKRDAQGNETILWQGGVNEPVGIVQNPDGSLTVANYGDGTLVNINSSGTITPFAKGLSSPQQVARASDGSYYAANSGTNTIVKVSPSGTLSTFATGFNGPYGVVFDSTGNLLVSDTGDNTIYRVHPDGTKAIVAQAIMNSPNAIAYGPDSSLYVAENDGVVRRTDTQGNVTPLASGLGQLNGIAVDSNNIAYASSYSTGKVFSVSTSGTQTFLSGLANPIGVAYDSKDQQIAVAEYGANRLRTFDLSGNQVARMDNVVSWPVSLAIDPSGNLYLANDTFISEFGSGNPAVLTPSLSASAVAYNPVTQQINALSGATWYAVANNGTTSVLATTPSSPMGLAIDDQGHAVLADAGRTNLYRSSASNTFAITATLSGETVTALASSVTGTVYIGTNLNHVYRLADNGTLTLLATWTRNIYSLGVGLSGRIAIADTGGDIVTVDPTSGQISSAISTTGYSVVGFDGSGNIVIASGSSTQQLRHYNSSGALLSSIFKISNPRTLAWTGTDYRFVDASNNLFSWTPGSYPVVVQPASISQPPVAWNNGSLFAISGSNIVQWNGTVWAPWATVPNAQGLSGLAARPDGSLAVADYYENRLVVFNASGQIIADVAGVAGPMGLAIDSQDRLYVAANTGGLVARIDAADPLPVTVAHLQNVNSVAVNNDGSFSATSGNDLYHVDTAGNVSDLGSYCCSLNNVVTTASGTYVSDYGYSQILRYDGLQLKGFVSGLSGANKVRLAPDGSLYVANGGNGTVVHYANGALTTVASGISGVGALAVAADGTVYAGGSSGAFARIGTDGTVSNLGVPELLAQEGFGGLVSLGPNEVAAATSASSGQQGAFYILNVIPPPAPPPVGSVVFSATAPVASLFGDTITPVDFGSWTPTLPGDYKLSVTHSAATGELDNFVHVGPFANGTLTTAATNVPPGNVLVPATLQVTGADYTALSQPEVSQLHLIATSLGATAIASDPSETIYYVDYSNGLFRLNADGTGTLLAGGFQFCYSVASDAAGRIYFTGKNTASGKYQLIRFDPIAQTQTVLYTSTTSGLSSMDVDAGGDVYLADGTQIYKIAPDGTSTLITETGVYDPISFSLDGNGDLFIENDDGTILELRNDGTLHTVFGTSNGNTTPSFEGPASGDSGRDIVGDCAGNLLIKSFKWSLVGQAGEEHTLAQVIPATGQVGLVIDTSILGLTDIDALAFDRFHNRALLRMDGGAIYSLPFTCGAVSVEAHVVTLPGQQLTGLSVPAAAAIPHTDGTTEYVFTLPNVQATGFDVGFDAPLTGLVMGQTQAIVGSAFLEFKNTFTGKDYSVPIVVPSVSVAAPAQLSVATDQTQYPANGTAVISATLTDPPGTAPVSGTLSLDVYDANNALVAHINDTPETVAAGASATATGNFPISTIVPGTYTAQATLTNASAVLVQASTTFQVIADNQAAEVTSQIAVDKTAYNPTDSATLLTHVTSQSANAILTNLNVTVTVADGSGNTLFMHSYAIAQLLPEQTLAMSTVYAFQNLAAATYTVSQQVTDSNSNVLDKQTASLFVAANAVQGLTATAQVTPTPVRIDQPFTCAVSVTNTATATASNLSLQFGILDLNSGNFTPLGSTTTSLATTAQWHNSAPVAAGQLAAGNFACAVQVNGANGWQTLAYSAFTEFMVADLSVQMTARSPNLAPGQIQFYHLAVTNLGPSTSTNATVAVQLPNYVPWIESGPGTLGCSASGSNVSCSVPSLAVNASADLCFAAMADTRGPASMLATAYASNDAGTTLDPNNANNNASASFNLVPELLYADGFDPCWFKTDIIYINGFEW